LSEGSGTGLFDGDVGISVPFWKLCGVSTSPAMTIAYLTRRECKRVGLGWSGVVAAGGNCGGAAIGVKDEDADTQRGRG